jgi:IS30 family transposase
MWEMDLIGPLPSTSLDNRYILTIVDHYSRWAWAEPIEQKNPAKIVEILKNIITNEKAKPEKILTDNGLEFSNSILKEFATKNEIVLKNGSPYHPQTTGSVERKNKLY